MPQMPTYGELEELLADDGNKAAALKIEKLFRSVVEKAPSGFALFDKRGNIKVCNRTLEKIVGYGKDELTRMNIETLTYPEDMSVEKHLLQGLREGKADEFRLEKRYVRKDGSIVWVDLLASVLRNGDGEATFCFAFARDITERKKAEQLLKEERDLQIGINSASSLEEVFQLCMDSALKVSDADCGGIYVFDDRDGCLELKCHRGMESLSIEEASRFETSSAFVRLVESAKPVYMNRGDILSASADIYRNEKLTALAVLPMSYKNCVVGCVNVASRRFDSIPSFSRKALETISQQIGAAIMNEKAEEALRESEERFRTLFEEVPGAIQGYTPDGKVRYWNKASETVYGYRKREAIGKNLLDLIIPSHMREQVVKAIGESAETGVPIAPGELELKRKDGSAVPVYSTHTIIGRKTGPPELYCLDIDLTEQKRLQKKLQEARKTEALGTLIGGISHDFNNLLGIIIGNAELAGEDLASWEPAFANIDEILKAGLRAKNIVRQLLSFSIDIEVQSYPVDLVPALRNSVLFLRSTAPSGMDVVYNCATDTAQVFFHPALLEKIMANLWENAMREMEDGGGSLKIEADIVHLDDKKAKRHLNLKKGDFFRLVVTDSGTGIDPSIIDRVFDPYFTTRNFGDAAGMGLAVVRGIVENHGGAVCVENSPGMGACFTILLPLIAEKARPCQHTLIDNETGGTETILYVDDESSLLEMVRQRLERLGYRVSTAKTPKIALEMLRSDPACFDLVISDMTMPQMTGIDVFEEIKAIRQDIPVILTTGHSDLIDRAKAMEMGADGYLEKPFDKNELSDLVVNALKNRRAR